MELCRLTVAESLALSLHYSSEMLTIWISFNIYLPDAFIHIHSSQPMINHLLLQRAPLGVLYPFHQVHRIHVLLFGDILAAVYSDHMHAHKYQREFPVKRVLEPATIHVSLGFQK